MRRVREVLRLAASGLTPRRVARGAGIARSTAAECLRRAQAAGIGWPPPADLDEAGLEHRLYPHPPPRADAQPLPDCARLHAELRHKGVTLRLLWQEYHAEHPDGYQYSRFCDHYRAWRQDQDVVLRQTHAPGDKCFVDYAGPTMPVTDPRTGEVRQAQIFVGVLGYSNYAYVEATGPQGAADMPVSAAVSTATCGCGTPSEKEVNETPLGGP